MFYKKMVWTFWKLLKRKTYLTNTTVMYYGLELLSIHNAPAFLKLLYIDRAHKFNAPRRLKNVLQKNVFYKYIVLEIVETI